MKKTLLFATISLFIFITGCSAKIPIPDGVRTPNYANAKSEQFCSTLGPQFAPGELVWNDFTFIADVTVNGWLDECTDCTSTYYSLTVNRVFYGEAPQDRIVLNYFGSTELMPQGAYNMYEDPPLVQGERLIIIAWKNDTAHSEEEWREAKGTDYPKWMNADVLYDLVRYCSVVEYEGESYVVSLNAHLTEPVADHAVELDLMQKLVAALKESFPEQTGRAYCKAFAYDTFVDMINDCCDKTPRSGS